MVQVSRLTADIDCMTDAGGHTVANVAIQHVETDEAATRPGWRLDVALLVIGGIVLQALVGSGQFGDGVLAAVVAQILPVAVFVWTWRGLRSMPIYARGAWTWLLTGLAMWMLGDMAWAFIDLTVDRVPPASWADALYISGYPALALGIRKLVTLRSPGISREDTVDSIAMALAGVLFAWFTMVAPVRDEAATWIVQGLRSGYALGDGLLLAAIAWLLFTPGKRCRSLILALAFAFGVFVLDVSYFALASVGAGRGIAAVNALYPVAYLLLGLAIRDRTVVEVTASTHLSTSRMNPVRLAISGATLYVAPVIVFVQGRSHINGAVLMLFGSLALSTLVLVRIILVVRDREDMEQAAAHRALHDGLTGFANRELFLAHVQRALANQARTGAPIAVLFIDLDRFKSVNDTWGHAIGDLVLIEVSNCMRACVRAADVVARIGGDEFAVLCEGAGDDVVQQIADRLVDALPNDMGEEARLLSASVGVAVNQAGEQIDAEALVHRADLAMYRIKADGGRAWQRFDQDMERWANEQRMVETDLAGALERHEMRLMYQPIVQLDPPAVVGVEALLRWDRPGSGTVSPAVFIPVAEATGLIVSIGEWVMHEACRFAAQHQDLYVTLNVSAVQVNRSDIVSALQRAIDASGVQPERLVVELTESALMTNVDKVQSTLQQLVDLGVRISLDDFGTGYSSLAYLDRFPVSTVKVDRSLVDRIESDSAQGAVVRAVVGLAPALGFTVVAEGVERESQRDALAALGIPLCQGWLFAPALAPEKLDEYIASFRVEATALLS